MADVRHTAVTRAAGPCALALALLGFQYAVRLSGFSAASGDDFFRALTTLEWLRAPGLTVDSLPAISVLWLPLHFWVSGGLAALLGGVVPAMMLISGLSAAAILLLSYRLASILFGRRSGYVAMLLAGTLPVHIWLGLSMSEMSTYCAALMGAAVMVARWQQTRAPSAALGAAFLFLLATALRSEGWVFAALFSCSVLFHLLASRFRAPGRGALLAAMVVPGLFIAFWLIRNTVAYGDPIHFLRYSKSITQAHIGMESLAAWVRWLNYPFLLLVTSPLLLLLILAGLLTGGRGRTRAQVVHLLLTAIPFAVMVLASAWGAGTKALPQRYVLATALLLIPFAARLAADLLASPGRRRAAGGIILSAVVLAQGYKAFQYPTLYADVVRAGRYMSHVRGTGAGADGTWCSELAFRRLRGERLDGEGDFLVLASAHVALMVYGGDPDAVTLGKTVLPEKQALLAPPDPAAILPDGAEMDRRLRAHGVTCVVLSRRESMEALPEGFRLLASFGAVGVFGEKGPAGDAARRPAGDAGPTPAGLELARGIRLAEYGYGRGPFPGELRLVWDVDGPATNRADLRMALEFTRVDPPRSGFQRALSPIMRWQGPTGRNGPSRFEESVALALPKGMPEGRYRVRLALTAEGPEAPPGGQPGPAADLGCVTLIHAKREVLTAFLRGEWSLWPLVIRVLLSL